MTFPPVNAMPQFACSSQSVRFGAKWFGRKKNSQESKPQQSRPELTMGERMELRHYKENMKTKKGRLYLAEEVADLGSSGMALGSLLLFPPLVVPALGVFAGARILERKASKIDRQDLERKALENWSRMSETEREAVLKEIDRKGYRLSAELRSLLVKKDTLPAEEGQMADLEKNGLSEPEALVKRLAEEMREDKPSE